MSYIFDMKLIDDGQSKMDEYENLKGIGRVNGMLITSYDSSLQINLNYICLFAKF